MSAVSPGTRGSPAAAAITLLITHRFPAVRMADVIVVPDGAPIVEQGGHGELMAREGRYAELHAIQRAAADGQVAGPRG